MKNLRFTFIQIVVAAIAALAVLVGTVLLSIIKGL
jgi:hypothetical protein